MDDDHEQDEDVGGLTPEDPTAVLFRRTLAHLVDSAVYLAAVLVPLWLLASDGPQPGGVAVDTILDRVQRIPEADDEFGFYLQGTQYVVDRSDLMVAGAIGLGVFVLCTVILEGLAGMTPGKAVFGIRTVRADGRKPGVIRAFGRSIMWVFDAIPSFVIPLVGAVVALLTTGRRRLGDLVGRTYVVGRRFAGEPVLSLGADESTDDGEDDAETFDDVPPEDDTIVAPTGVPADDDQPSVPAGDALDLPEEDPALFATPEVDDLEPTATDDAPPTGGTVVFADPDAEPEPGPEPEPEPEPEAALTDEPEPSGEAEPAGEAAAAAQQATPAREPQWDAARRAYIIWDDARGEWLQHDTEQNAWVPISRA